MSAVLLAVYRDFETADRVRCDLICDGFPTDRVELTSCCSPGRAALVPAESMRDKLAQYFRTLFVDDDGWEYGGLLAERVECGAATVTVHPRGAVETARAVAMIEAAEPVEIARQDLAKHGWEYAASSSAAPWFAHLWIHSTNQARCIYCRLFARSPVAQPLAGISHA